MGIVRDFQDAVLPVIIFFIFVNVVGLIGNIVVMYVYSCRYEKNHFRKLVLSLCFVDLLSCFTTVPMETVSTWLWFNYPSRVLCKTKNFFVQFWGLSAMFMLFLAAVYNYRRICGRFGWQITKNLIGDLFMIGIAMSLVFAFPAPILWDVNYRIVEFSNRSESLLICEVHKHYHETFYPMLYRSILSVYDIFLLATIAVYILIARQLISERRKRHSRTAPGHTEADSSTSDTDETEQSLSHNENDTEVGIHNMPRDDSNITSDTEDNINTEYENYMADQNNLAHNNSVSNEVRDSDSDSEERRPLLLTRANVTQPTSRQFIRSQPQSLRPFQLSPTRKALIMAILAVAFAITFIMGLSFGYVFALRDYGDYSSLRQIVTLFVCYRLYFATFALNPFIYFILDRNFRREVFRLLRVST